MSDFDPSPRASKRRRTGTYATRRRTLASSPSEPAENKSQATPKSKARLKQLEKDELALDAPEAEPTLDQSTSNRNSKRKTAEDEISEVVASAQAVTPSKRLSKSTDAVVDAPQAAAEAAVDTGKVKRRSVGRPRRSLQNSSPAPEQSKSQPSTRKCRLATNPSALDEQVPQSVLSPQPKGILTPSRSGRGQRNRPRKSVVFDDGVGVNDKDEKEIEEHFGFKDIGKSSKQNTRTAQPISGSLDHEAEEVFEEAEESLGAQTGDVEVDELVEEDELEVADIPMDSSANELRLPSTEEEDPHVISIKHQVLSRMISHSYDSTPAPIPSHLETQYSTLHALLTATVTAGESNSLLLLGSRGSGKSLLVEHALSDLQRSHGEDFHAVRLNGFFQTDDKIALREIWRQLGREMAVPEDETGEVSSYADTMASLLSLLSHPEELGDASTMEVDMDANNGEQAGAHKTSKSVIFIMDEFDLFTTHPRQTLLYNLFDIAQAKKAPIAVIGCSTRMDVVDCLEKRVKSRFSHRWLHIPTAKSILGFEECVKNILCLPTEGKEALGVAADELEWRSRWNEVITTQFLPAADTQRTLKGIYHSTKSLPDVLAALHLPIAMLNLPADGAKDGTIPLSKVADTISSSPSLLGLLPHLPILHLSLLISATRLETIYDLNVMNFMLVHKQYTELLTRSKLQKSSFSSLSKGGSVTGAGLKSWSKETARAAWEELAQWEVIVPASSSAMGRGGDDSLGGDGIVTKMFRVDVTLDEVVWAVKEKLGSGGAGESLMKWCKEV